MSVLVLTIASATWVSAQDNGSEVVPMLYMQVPFGGGSSTQDDSSYGMAFVTKAPIQIGGDISAPVNLLDTNRPRLLDMRFKQHGFDSLKLNGVSLVQKVITHNADGTTTEETTTNGLTTGQMLMIGLGVGGLLCAADVICDDKDDHEDETPAPDDVVEDDAV